MQDANVNLAALQYYFDGKEGLYRACAEHIADQVQPRLDALSAAVRLDSRAKHRSRDEAMQMLTRFLGAAADNLLVPGFSGGWLMFINREQMFQGPAFDILYDRVVRRLLTIGALLVGPAIGEPPQSEAAIIQTIAMLGPLFIFQRAPSIALHALDWPALDGERLDHVKRVVVRQSLQGLATRSRR